MGESDFTGDFRRRRPSRKRRDSRFRRDVEGGFNRISDAAGVRRFDAQNAVIESAVIRAGVRIGVKVYPLIRADLLTLIGFDRDMTQNAVIELAVIHACDVRIGTKIGRLSPDDLRAVMDAESDMTQHAVIEFAVIHAVDVYIRLRLRLARFRERPWRP